MKDYPVPYELAIKMKFSDLLVHTGLCKSKSEAKRLCRQGGVTIYVPVSTKTTTTT